MFSMKSSTTTEIFQRLGLSNHSSCIPESLPVTAFLTLSSSWEVAEIVQICKINGYIQPSAYEGTYNALHRSVELELFPCLENMESTFMRSVHVRYLPTIKFRAYKFILAAGGFFTERYTSIAEKPEKGSPFDPECIQGQVSPNKPNSI
jgi:aflatoxin B1 aldehyde reductase